MIHFTTTFLAAALIAQLEGVSATGLTLKVLTGTAANACSAQQVTILKQHLTEVASLAEAASKALKVKGVETSDAFTKFLGNAHPSAIDAGKYAPVATLGSIALKEVTSDEGHAPKVAATAPHKETLFMCLPASDAKCGVKGDTTGKANGMLAWTSDQEHTLKLCPLFFGEQKVYNPYTKTDITMKPQSLATFKSEYLAGKDDRNSIPVMTLLHEFQHTTSVVDAYIDDLYVNKAAPTVVIPKTNIVQGGAVARVYTVDLCSGIAADKKAINAQNIAFFAVDVYADPTRGQPCAEASTSSGSKTPPHAKRFEAINERRAIAAAKPAAVKSTTKPPAAGAKSGSSSTTGKSTTGSGTSTGKTTTGKGSTTGKTSGTSGTTGTTGTSGTTTAKAPKCKVFKRPKLATAFVPPLDDTQ